MSPSTSRRTRSRWRHVAVLALALLAAAHSVAAQGGAERATSPAQPAVTWAEYGARTWADFVASLPDSSTVKRAWRAIWDAYEAVGVALTPPTPLDYLPPKEGSSLAVLLGLLDEIGYRMQTLETTSGLVPEVTLKLVMARQLSDTEHDAAQRDLDKLAAAPSAPIGARLRRIAQVLIDAQEVKGYRIDSLDIALWPWQTVHFTMMPDNAPLPGGQRRLLSEIEALVRPPFAAPRPPIETEMLKR
jgi:hypothetical protein